MLHELYTTRGTLYSLTINHTYSTESEQYFPQLIATPLLHELIRDGRLPSPFHDIAGTSIISRRSPLLTNGRGTEFQQDHVEGMALGDHFVDTIQKAWVIQDARQRQSMSPKYVRLILLRKA